MFSLSGKFQPALASTTVVPVPRPIVSSASAGTDSSAPLFSGDSRFLFFQSTANDLVSNDSSLLTLDLFRYELSSSQLIRVSAEPVVSGKPADWVSPAMSADGDLIVFASLSTAIVAGKTNARVMDIFWKRISTGELGLVSISTNGVSGGNADSREPVISEDGRYVAFESDATDLAPLDDVSVQPGFIRSVVYVRDLKGGNTVAVSAPSDGTDISVSGYAPSLSTDGHLIAFYTKTPNPAAVATRLVVQNHLTGELLWTYTIKNEIVSNCRGPKFSPDGKRVAFFSRENFARMRLAVHDLDTNNDHSLTNDFLLCAPIVWSSTSKRIYFETFFQIASWDLETEEVQLQNLRNPVSQSSGASWSGIVVSKDDSFVIYRDDRVLAPDTDNRPIPGLFLRQWPAGETNLITRDPAGAPSLQDEIGNPVLSSDNRWIAFEASDSTLVERDLNRSKDIFLHDRLAGTTRLVSSHNTPDSAATGNSRLIGAVSLAADHRLLAFSAGDGNYSPGDTNRSADVFVQDVKTSETHNVTLNQTGFEKPFHRYLAPQLSASGSVVAFLGYPVNLADPSGSPLATELHTLNISTGERQVLMTQDNMLGLQSIPATPVFQLSANGERVVFGTVASDFGLRFHIAIRDLATRANQWVSVTPSGIGGNGDSTQPLITPDGNRVIFLSTASDLLSKPVLPVLRRLYQRDIAARKTQLLSTNLNLYPIDAPVMSPDGKYAAFRMGQAPRTDVDALARIVDLVGSGGARTYPGVRQIYGFDQQAHYAVGLMTNASDFSAEGTLCRLDLTTGNTLTFSAGRGVGFWVSVAPDSPPVISADGRYIVFESPDDSLVAGDNNRVSDIFVRDTVQGTTLLVSANQSGTGSGNGVSAHPTLSADGKSVVFRSRASDLVPSDYNGHSDLYILTFASPDTDGDGLPDDWEMTYFNSLSRDGTGDADSDGQTDAAEYWAGTDPTGASSVLRVLTLQSAGGSGTEIIWAAVAGKHYRVEYNDSVTSANWIHGMEDYTASGNTGRWTDITSLTSGHRFYRVVVVQ